MEKLQISWSLSPSTFVEKQQVFVKTNGGTATQMGVDLPSNQDTIDLDFNVGDTIIVFIRTIGDNGSQADSPNSLPYIVANLETVKAAGTPTITWLSHTP